MKLLRPATQEEVASITAKSDIDQSSEVLALDTPNGPILMVHRVAHELDPMILPKGFTVRHFHNALRDASNFLLGRGVTHFYFNLHADAEEYISAMTTDDTRPVSTQPEIRFRKQIFSDPQEAPQSHVNENNDN